MDTKRQGGCQCGAVRYEVQGEPSHETLCHCTFCRRASAAPVVAWFSVAPEAFSVTRGELKRFNSSAHAVRSFCGECGTPLTYQRYGVHEVDITTCSLDEPEADTFVRSALKWGAVEDGLPRYLGLRDG